MQAATRVVQAATLHAVDCDHVIPHVCVTTCAQVLGNACSDAFDQAAAQTRAQLRGTVVLRQLLRLLGTTERTSLLQPQPQP